MRGLERRANKGLEEFLEMVRIFCSIPCRASLISSKCDGKYIFQDTLLPEGMLGSTFHPNLQLLRKIPRAAIPSWPGKVLLTRSLLYWWGPIKCNFRPQTLFIYYPKPVRTVEETTETFALHLFQQAMWVTACCNLGRLLLVLSWNHRSTVFFFSAHYDSFSPFFFLFHLLYGSFSFLRVPTLFCFST